ncbi:MAG: serine hydrolase [Oscillospiraceae bacterium]|nr:serine hydrolase [Oscillospiraceae bacterium]
MNISTAGRTVQLLKRICDTKTATQAFLPPAGEKRSLPLRAAQQPFPRATPESQGISSDHIRRFLEELGRGKDLYMQNVLILRNGKLLCAAAFGAQTLDAPKYTFSACKSVTSLAIGLLIDDGALHLDDTLGELFPDLLSPVTSRRLREVTVEDLLTMRSGIQFSEPQSVTENHWLRAIFSDAPADEPGAVFHYNSLNSYLLSVIIRSISGESLSALLQRRLFEPMGITDTLWERSGEGIEKGGWGLYIRPEDMAKLGQLVMNGGIWHGKRLISQTYLTAATTAHAAPPVQLGSFDYGYHIWIGRKENTFLFNGMLGQNVLGYRDSGILIATNAGADTDYQEGRFFEIVSRYFGVAFPDILPSDAEAYTRLRACVHELSAYNRPNEVPDERAAPFLHRNFVADDPCSKSTGLLPVLLQIVHNNYTTGLHSIAISQRGIYPEIIYREMDAVHRFPIGLGKPVISELIFHGDCFRVAAYGRFTHDEEDRSVFYVRLDFLETPSVRILKLVLTENGFLLKQTETPGVPYFYQKLLMAAQQPLLRPVLLLAVGGSEDDYLLYKAQRLLSPEIRLLTDN